jgi:signal peptidase II
MDKVAANKTGTAWWFLLVIVLVIADQLTKWMASTYLEYNQPLVLLPVLNFTLLHNPGAAFSFLSDAGGWQRWFFTTISLVVSVVLTVWICRLKKGQAWLAASLALILSGAVGNLIDRVLFGYVIDFISVHYDRHFFPAFNIADSAITIGAGMMLLDVFLNPQHHAGEAGKDRDKNGDKAEARSRGMNK